jgi:uncharacterized SAM-binding protein YcdF (DUF218 family)
MKVDAIVVLGCGLEPGGELGGAARRRAKRAARAFRDGVAAWVVASGGRRWYGVAEAEAFRLALVQRGVPAERVLMELCSMSTSENAALSAQLLQSRGWRSVAIVTCDWHMPRALRCFGRANVSAAPLPAPSPPAGPLRRVGRSLKERAREVLDRAMTFG